MEIPERERDRDESLKDSPVPYFIFGRPEPDLGRVLSLVIGAGYLLIGGYLQGVGGSLRAFAFVVMPLVLIWFGDDLGEHLGSIGSRTNRFVVPGFAVRLCGWLVLLAPLWLFVIVGSIRWLN